MFKISFILLLFVIVILFQKGVRSQQCGVSMVGRGNIVGGNYVSHGQFPWFATIMKLDNKGEAAFRCGGTLISNKLVLTGKLNKIKNSLN
jgi:secreted trypsin-like serine protease